MKSKSSLSIIKCIFTMVLVLSIFKLNSGIAQSKVLQVGEELNYSVNYGFIEIGKVNIKMTGHWQEGKNEIYTSVCTMRSNNGIPFVELNSIFETDMVYDGNELYTVRFKATEIKEDGQLIIEYKLFGLSGEFAGWFSDDEARVPLKSQMNVIIGSVTLELNSYKRSGWK
ncbi:MAG: hypothetical protein IPM96_14365 [Ignavibacteria bacterium]|nr:hypothetical protein [Ignavibacteria bacterium]